MAENIYAKENIKTTICKVTNTVDWFAHNTSIYRPRPDTVVEFLNCGVKAFSEIYKAIANAEKSVEIVIWGFDPLMRFNPDMTYCKEIQCYPEIDNMTISELLEYKADKGVKVKLLVWYSFLATVLGESTVRGIAYNNEEDAEQQAARDYSDDYYKFNELTKRCNDLIEQQKRLELSVRENSGLTPLETDKRDYLSICDRSSKGLSDEEKETYTSIQCIEQKADPETAKIAKEQLDKTNTELEARLKEREELRKKLDTYGELQNSGAPKAYPEDQKKVRDWVKRATNNEIENLSYETRHFTYGEKGHIGSTVAAEEGRKAVGFGVGLIPSHHQKLILVDYDTKDPEKAVGFVMGHNMHRQYWDAKDHYYDDWDAHRPTGFGPWQDISTKVHGAILFDINDNIVKAWRRNHTHLFGLYQSGIASDDDYFERRDAKNIPADTFALKPDSKAEGYRMQAQFCRTQMQETNAKGENDKSILEIYHKAIDNATNYIYMENQYFRYPSLIQKVVDRAKQNKALAKQYDQKPSPLYYFVLTNAPNDKKFSSTTYDSLKTLGQEQLMPNTQRDGYHERGFLHYICPYHWGDPRLTDEKLTQSDIERLKEIKEKEDIDRLSMDPDQAKAAEAKKQQEALEKGEEYTPKKVFDVDSQDPKDRPFDLHTEEMEKNNGLKTIIGVLTSDSSVIPPDANRDNQNLIDNASDKNPDGTPRIPYGDGNQSRYQFTRLNKVEYRSIYIHSKFIVVDDLFSFVGSANINTRSFMGDSESGIAMANPGMAHAARTELWEQHAKASFDNNEFTCSAAIQCDGERNYDHWDMKMNRNWKNKAKGEPLECHITRFWDTETKYANALD